MVSSRRGEVGRPGSRCHDHTAMGETWQAIGETWQAMTFWCVLVEKKGPSGVMALTELSQTRTTHAPEHAPDTVVKRKPGGRPLKKPSGTWGPCNMKHGLWEDHFSSSDHLQARRIGIHRNMSTTWHIPQVGEACGEW